MAAELANWHDDLVHDIVEADMLRGASPEDAIAFGQYVEDCFAELIANELKAEIDRQMIDKLAKTSIGKMDPKKNPHWIVE
jgi:hypothetical protein